jgi:choice-of-anchor C domain-containing protein
LKRRFGFGTLFGFLAAIALAGPTLAFTGLTNGGFETGAYVDNGSGFRQLNAPNGSIVDWTVDAGSVDWIGTYWPAQEGSKSIDMSGVEAGTLSQTFTTTIGNTYNVSFQLSGNPAGDPTLKTLEVSATGGTVGLYSYDVTGNDLTHMNWVPETYSFLATSASTTLSFVSTTAGAFGPAIDNVVVTEDVPTKVDCKQGGWQTMIDNTGNSFKNQGDCVSYFATKGKNLGALPPAAATGASAATQTDSAISPAKLSSKQEKATARAERHDAKDKSKSQADRGHGPKPKKTK